jgi:hypothetical protein
VPFTVASFQDPVEAQIVCALLQSEGLSATVADLNLVTANWPWALAVGGVKVQVPHEEFEQAKQGWFPPTTPASSPTAARPKRAAAPFAATRS